jgi:large subunit ribosomal protein L15
MYLNKLKPSVGSKKKSRRVGRGIGCAFGKTCGKGHKGQKARAGGFHKIGFEGGQMPLQRRLPKVGFKSHAQQDRVALRLSDLQKFSGEEVSLSSLIKANRISANIKIVKIIDSGTLTVPIALNGVFVTEGAMRRILSAGGKVEV